MDPEEAYKKAMKLISRGRCSAAVELLTYAGARGHLSSRAELANLLIWGRIGVEKNAEGAYYQLLGPGRAVMDNPDCKGMAAYCMYHDYGTKVPKTDAALGQIWDLIQQSRTGNSKFGFFMMGELHIKARFEYIRVTCGIEEDVCKALEYYERASSMGCDLASYEAGKIYSFTQGFINLRKSMNYLEIAAIQGNPLAIDYLASCHYENRDFIKCAVACQYLLTLKKIPKGRELHEAMLMGCGVPHKPLPASESTNFKANDCLIIDINNAAKGYNDELLFKFLTKLFDDNPLLDAVATGSEPTAENMFASLLERIPRLEKRLYDRTGVKEGPGPDLTMAKRIHLQTAGILRNREAVSQQNVDELMAAMNGTAEEREAAAKRVAERNANLLKQQKKIYVFTADGNADLGYDSIHNAIIHALDAGCEVISVVSCDIQKASKNYQGIRRPNYKLITLTEFIKSIYPNHNFGETVLNLPEYNPSISLAEAMDVMAFDDNIKGKIPSTNRQLLSKVISHMRWKDDLNKLLLKNAICNADTNRLQDYEKEDLVSCFEKDLKNEIQTIAVIEYLLQIVKTLKGEPIDDYVKGQPILAYSAKDQLWLPATVLNVEKSEEKTTYSIQFNGSEKKCEFESKNILPDTREPASAVATLASTGAAEHEVPEVPLPVAAKAAAALAPSGAAEHEEPEVPFVVAAKAAAAGPAGAVDLASKYVKTQPMVPARGDGRYSGKVKQISFNYAVIQLDDEKTTRKYVDRTSGGIVIGALKKNNRVLVTIQPNGKGEYIITNVETNLDGGSIEDIYKKKYLKYKNKYIQLKLNFQ